MPISLQELRREAEANFIPILRADTEIVLRNVLAQKQPKRILEIGAAIGYSALVMLSVLPKARLTTLEIRHCRYARALSNLTAFGCAGRAVVLCEDATAYLAECRDTFDFIFLDGPKAQYAKMLPRLGAILSEGGVLFADNLSFGGRTGAVRAGGRAAIPRKHRAAADALIAFCDALDGCGFRTEYSAVGDGIAISEKL